MATHFALLSTYGNIRKRHHSQLDLHGAGNTGNTEWAQQLTQEGQSEELTALAEAAALSVRSTHPVSQALVLCASSAASALPQIEVHDFHQQPGTPWNDVCHLS